MYGHRNLCRPASNRLRQYIVRDSGPCCKKDNKLSLYFTLTVEQQRVFIPLYVRRSSKRVPLTATVEIFEVQARVSIIPTLDLLQTSFFSLLSRPIHLSHAFENLTLALCKFQKWKEQVKVSWCRKFGDLIIKTAALVNISKIENVTKNVAKTYIERASMPFQPRSHINYHTLSIKSVRLFFWFQNLTSVSVFDVRPLIFQY